MTLSARTVPNTPVPIKQVPLLSSAKRRHVRTTRLRFRNALLHILTRPDATLWRLPSTPYAQGDPIRPWPSRRTLYRRADSYIDALHYHDPEDYTQVQLSPLAIEACALLNIEPSRSAVHKYLSL